MDVWIYFKRKEEERRTETTVGIGTNQSVAVLSKTLWGPGPRAPTGGTIISSRWKNWGAWTKSEGAEVPPARAQNRHCSQFDD